MFKIGLYLVLILQIQHGMAKFWILLGKMRTLNANGANDCLHLHTHFQTMDNGLPNTIAQNQDWFERMTQNNREF